MAVAPAVPAAVSSGNRGRRRAEFIAGDPIRGIAVLAVVIYHAAAFAVIAKPGAFTSSYGGPLTHVIVLLELAYYAFFVLSGYLIAGPFVRAFIEGREPPSVPTYLRNRALRLVPALWVIFTLLLVWHGTFDASTRQIVAVYGFAQSLDPSIASFLVGPAWTLHIEVGFYLAVPVVAAAATRVAGPRLGHDGRLRLVLVLMALVAVAGLAFRELVPATPQWQRSAPAMLYTFCPGVALAALELIVPGRMRTWSRASLAAPLILAGSLVATMVYVTIAGSGYEVSPRTGLDVGLAAMLATGGWVAAALVHQWHTGSCPRIVNTGAARWLGVRSYSLYVIHQGVLLTFFNWEGYPDSPVRRWILLVLLAVPCCLFAAWVSFAVLERPFLRRRGRWRRGEAAEPRPVPG